MEATQKSVPIDTAEAVQQWRRVLPTGALLPESDIARYEKNCLSLSRRIIAAIQPASEADVIAAVRIANQYRVPLYTISTGHNWGYGTSAPAVDDCAILDLSRMNTISGFDPEIGLITVEPGVTQQQLFGYLANHGYDFYVPTTGAGPSASIVGNALEHGFGMTPHGDHFQAVTSVRAILADGSVYQSGTAEAGAPQAGVWKWGVGPYLDGLFAQGNAGIVTALQISLAPRAEHTELFMFTMKNAADLQPTLKACRTLYSHMRGGVSGIKIFNKAYQESFAASMNTEVNLSGDFAWMGTGVLRCPKSTAGTSRREVRRLLEAHASRVVFLTEKRITLAKKIFRLFPKRKRESLMSQLERIDYLMDLVNGIPRADAQRLVYQYVPQPTTLPADPIQDGVGLMWYAPIMPLKMEILANMISMIQETLAKHGFRPAVIFSVINDKCAIGAIPVIYDKKSGGEKANACFKELWEHGNALGCPPYRMNSGMMERLTGASGSVFWQTTAKIKQALDPNQILSPGRYSPID